jgi:histidinol-phosphatase
VDTGGDLERALTMSDIAAELALQYFLSGASVTHKPDGSPVTEADHAVEQLLRSELGVVAPGDAVIGEECGVTGGSHRRWILDPIDGTSCFARNDPNWRVHVALEVAGRIDVAVITSPATGVQWRAQRSHGAYESSWPQRGRMRRLAVSDTATINDALLSASHGGRARLPSVRRPPLTNSGVWCAGLIGLVRGEVDACLAECCQVWDHAPWVLLVEEAGGRFSSRRGDTVVTAGGGLYSNAALHEPLRAALGYPSAD